LIGVPNGLHSMIPHKFGDLESDRALLLEHTQGLVSLMHEISDEARSACPPNSVESVNACLDKALCLIQSQVDAVKNQTDLQKYALYEEMYSRFNDISWPTIAVNLKMDNHQKVDDEKNGYMAPAQHSCHGTDHDISSMDLIEIASEDGASSKAAAYRTSAALHHAAKTAHAVMDSHLANSSVDATLVALHEAWGAPCKMLGCDATNFLDLYRASHSHSLALMEMGASAHHMQVHIRTRQRLHGRMQAFLGEHGQHFQPHILRDEDSDPRHRAAAKQYFARGRGSMLQFVTEYPKTRDFNTLDYPLSLVDTQKMQEFFEARGKAHLLEVLRSERGVSHIDSDEEEEAMVQEEEQEQNEEEDQSAGRRRRRRRRRRGGGSVVKAIVKVANTVANGVSNVANHAKPNSLKGLANKISSNAGRGFSNAFNKLSNGLRNAGNHISQGVSNVGNALNDFGNGVANGMQDLGNDIAFVADMVGDAMNDFVQWVLTLFECLGQFHETVAIGYGKKWGGATGVAVSFGGSTSYNMLQSLILGQVSQQLKLSLSFVAGAVPGDAVTGGARAGVGIALGISCSSAAGCNLGITVGATGSALIPGSASGAACPFGYIVTIGGVQFGCFYSYTVAVTAMCCQFNLLTGSENCR